ncbi:MAG: nucleoside hydrolase [Chloroflexi bacterium]|nr:nucleoside hydrolase [Chloroflexota bacterium]
MPQKVIIDCDPGHDDALALLLAFARPELAVAAVTTVAGNQTVDKTFMNALKVLSYAGIRNVPVARGMDRPLVRPLVTAPHVHGESGLEGPILPTPTIEPSPLHAVDLIIKTILESQEKVTLIPTGPLTNVAMALLQEPKIKDNVKEIVLMGGAIMEGNITPAAEFNIFVDPEAASVVFNCGLPLTMVGLDVTHKAIVTHQHAQDMRAMGKKVATMVADLLDFYGRFHDKVYNFGGSPIHDAVAVAQVIRPGIVRTEKYHVDVETRGEFTAGRTVVDLRRVTEKEPNVDVGVDLDREAFLRMLFEAIRQYD